MEIRSNCSSRAGSRALPAPGRLCRIAETALVLAAAACGVANDDAAMAVEGSPAGRLTHAGDRSIAMPALVARSSCPIGDRLYQRTDHSDTVLQEVTWSGDRVRSFGAIAPTSELPGVPSSVR